MQVIANGAVHECDSNNFAKCNSHIFQDTSAHIRDYFMHFQNKVCKIHAQGSDSAFCPQISAPNTFNSGIMF